MRDLILHIGLPKTGTTSIQAALSASSDTMETHGFYVPKGLNRSNHARLALAHHNDPEKSWEIQARGFESKDKLRATVVAEFAAAPSDKTTVVSSERLSLNLREPSVLSELAALCAEYFERTRIILYLRRQDHLLRGLWATQISNGADARFETTLALLRPLLDFTALVGHWADAFGAENVDTRIFDKKALANGDVVADFMAAIGYSGPVVEPERLNETPSYPEILFGLRVVNAYKDRFGPKARFPTSLLKNIILGSPHDEPLQLTRTQTKELAERYDPTNAQICEQLGLDRNQLEITVSPGLPETNRTELTEEEILYFESRMVEKLADMADRLSKARERQARQSARLKKLRNVVKDTKDNNIEKPGKKA